MTTRVTTNSSTPRVIQVSCWRAYVGVETEVEPVDDRQAESVEGGHHGQQDRVGVGRHEPHHDVREDDERGQPPAVREDVGRDLALDAEAHGGVRADADGQREHEQEQLGPAPAAVHELHDHPGLAHGVALAESVGLAVAVSLGVAVASVVASPASASMVWLAARRRTASWASSRLSASMPSRTVEAS